MMDSGRGLVHRENAIPAGYPPMNEDQRGFYQKVIWNGSLI